MTNTAVGIRPERYRLHDSAHVGAVRLQVGDLARSLSFYAGVLGFRVLSQTAESAVLAPEGNRTALIELKERRGARAVPKRGLLGLYHFAILLPNREALGRFVAHIAEQGMYAGSADHLVSEAIYLSDPDGLGIEVYADRPRSTWTLDTAQIVMATKPLNLRELIRAARGEAWTGIPAGTAIGHVHFHVGALREAEAFYHRALGFDKVAWSYPGALFLSAGGYHHHVGANTWAQGAPVATPDDARLLEWELVLPGAADVDALAANAAADGHDVQPAGEDRRIADPWGITVRIVKRSNP